MKHNRIQYRYSTLRFRLFSLLGGVLALMMIIIVLSVFVHINNIERVSWQDRQSEAASYASQAVEEFLKKIEIALEMLIVFGRDEIKSHPGELEAFLFNNPAFMELVYLDQNGKIIANANRDQPLLANLFTIPQSEWFRRALQGERYFSRIQISSQGQAYIIYSMPVALHQDPEQPKEVFAARIQMDVLSQVVSNIRFGESGRAYIINKQGQIVAHSDPTVELGIANVSDHPEFSKVLNSPTRSWYGTAQNLTDERVLIASTIVEPTGWIVVTELPIQEAYANSRRAASNISLQLLAIAVVVMVLLIRGFNHLVLKPVDLLRNGALRLGEGELDHKIPVHRRDELGEVTAVFNIMASRLKAEQLALKASNEELENRVRQRTSELTRLNQALSHEIAERAEIELQVRASLQEKEILLKEIHHRVKNNLQIISSLLNMQSRKIKDYPTLAVLQESQNRVRSMSLIHEKLYRSGNLAQINLGEYVRTLSAFLSRTYQTAGLIRLSIQILPPDHPFEEPGVYETSAPPDILLDLDCAVPCGLLLNELLSNSFKYAFPENRQGSIMVTLQQTNNAMVFIRVADDGVGLPQSIDFEQINQLSSLGLQLVKSLVDQLEGTIELASNPNSGTCFTIKFPG